MKHLGMAYNIKNRAKTMAKGGSVHCAHGGPAYCNQGCYAEGGEVSSAPEASMKAMGYEKKTDEMEHEMANQPEHEMPDSMNSMEAEEEGDMVSEDSPMRMAKGGMMNGKKMAHMIMGKKMAKGGIVTDSEAALKEGEMHEPMGMYDESDDESMPLDHASEADERFGDESTGESEDMMFQPKKKDLLSRVMSRMR